LSASVFKAERLGWTGLPGDGADMAGSRSGMSPMMRLQVASFFETALIAIKRDDEAPDKDER
jgi:hypothetical protein